MAEKPPGKVFGVGGLAEDDAVAGEELVGNGVGPLGGAAAGVEGNGGS